MTAHDIADEPRSDPDLPDVPTTVVAVDADGRVVIYDRTRRGAWLSSTHAVAIRDAS